MSTKDKWRKSFQKTRSLSQSSLDLRSSTNLLDEADLSVNDEELEKYLGTLKKKSGVGRLWTGNTFGKMIDRTPDVSISSVSDGEAPNTHQEESQHSDDDFHPNLLGLSEGSDNDKKSETSEASSIKPLEAIRMISDLELSEDEPQQFNNVKHSASDKELDNLHMDIKSITNDLSKDEEVHTLDEVSEEIEEDLTDNSEDTSIDGLQKESKKSHHNKSNLRHSSEESSRKSLRTNHKKDKTSRHSSQSKSALNRSSRHHGSRKSSQNSSKKSDYSYSTDFSESSKQRTVSVTDNSSSYSNSSRTANSSKLSTRSHKSQRKSSKRNHRNNISHHDVATQVNLEDTKNVHAKPSSQLPAVGMATLGPSLGNHYVDPSPIAPHVVSADAVEALTAYNPAIVALTDMLRQQLHLVEQFVDNSRRMYESYTKDLNSTYKYTTLEDTMEYLQENELRSRHRKNRRKHDENT